MPSVQQRQAADFSMTVAGWNFALLKWESSSIREKVQAWWSQPAAPLSQEEGSQLVRDYLAQARQMGGIQGDINRRFSVLGDDVARHSFDIDRLEAELETLRADQQAKRVTVEQIIEQQVAWALLDRGIGLSGRIWPPVKFAFTEPPKKMVVSPRDRIETVYSQMLSADISLKAIEASEESIYDEYDYSGYITNIGGLGAYPAMVVDRASLRWVLSTVAHEWVHNYLTFFPLGINYLTSAEIATINETVATIVGDEIGDHALETFYPDVWQEIHTPANSLFSCCPLEAPYIAYELPRFDFNDEMRLTRLEVDRLLAAGQIEEAEAYMEERRLFFVENGYGLRVLNQAYFAFHGSYATGPASSDPIGPTLQELRAMQPDVATFLRAVRSMTSLVEIEEELGLKSE